MKQHITPEQLKELSPSGKKKLWELWEPKQGDLYYNYKNGGAIFTVRSMGRKKANRNDGKDKIYPILSIGQMIEFLDYHIDNLEIKGHSVPSGSLLGQSEYILVWDISGGEWNEIEDEQILCDALWEAVKEVLNEK